MFRHDAYNGLKRWQVLLKGRMCCLNSMYCGFSIMKISQLCREESGENFKKFVDTMPNFFALVGNGQKISVSLIARRNLPNIKDRSADDT